MGRAADSSNRRNIIVIGCFIWNAALAGMGSSTAFWELLVYRLVLGFGQAFSNPASYSMITDLFPPDQRPFANGLFATGCYIGGGLASLSEILGESMGWRWTMFLCAAIGAGFATIMMLTMFEPKRQGAKEIKAASGEEKSDAEKAEEAKPTFMATLAFLFTDPHTAFLLLAASIRFMGGYAIAGYLPTFYESKWSSLTSQYSEINAFVVAFGGFFSSFLGGKITSAWLESAKSESVSYAKKKLATRLSYAHFCKYCAAFATVRCALPSFMAYKRPLFFRLLCPLVNKTTTIIYRIKPWPGASKANYYVPMIGCLSAIPFMLIALYSPNFYVSLCLGLLGEYLTAECWFGPYMSALTAGVPSQMRATAVATMMFTATFMGSLISYVIGVLEDYYVDSKGDSTVTVLTWLLLFSVVGTYLISALLFSVASRYAPLTEEEKRAGGSTETTSLLTEDNSA